MTRRWPSGARGLLLALFAVVSVCLGFDPRTPAMAQAASDTTPQKQPDKMFVEADQLVYDKDKNTVSAVGNARIYYQGRTLEADKIIYDRNSGRVYATGHAKMINKDGNIIYGDVMDMTKDFRDGFVESLRLDDDGEDLLQRPARGDHAGRNLSLQQGHIHGLRSLRRQSVEAAVVACARQAHRP